MKKDGFLIKKTLMANSDTNKDNIDDAMKQAQEEYPAYLQNKEGGRHF